jgi:multicomponent Na+:H+ antiporter subunit D
MPALPVAIPFIAAAVLVASGAFLPRLVSDLSAVITALAVAALCAVLLHRSAHQPIAYWMGGWRPNHAMSVGISFSLDPFGTGLALFAVLLVTSALVYATRYFDAVAGLFHGLMLVFCAAMAGFCFTGDLFNLIVFFELMSAVAYALTAYRIEERAPIQGAINFAVTNSIAGYTMFIAAALLYARTGALNMASIGAALDGHHADPLVVLAMALLFLGFLTKAAAVPLHFWLADAHAVAPVPVCVLFSGVMVELGVYAVARLYWTMFAGVLGSQAGTLRPILVTLGVVTALVGAFMCVMQRHIKRLLAFSTISHVGMFICGVGLLEHRALAGVAVYVLGHGLTKAALFMAAGVLLHRFGTVDEFDLHGRGRTLPAVGTLFVVGGLFLAAVPPFTTFAGKSLLEGAAASAGYGWLLAVFVVISAATGGAVLRVAGRVFGGWGPSEGPDPAQARAAAERVDETRATRDRTPRVMVIVPAVLLVVAAVVGLVPGLVPSVQRMAARFTDHGAYTVWVLRRGALHWPTVVASPVDLRDVLLGLLSTMGAVGLALAGLLGRPLREALPARVSVPSRTAVRAIRRLHSGHIGDYISWWAAGSAVLAGACLLALT